MTFISEALYRSLKTEQKTLLQQISDYTAQSTALTSRVRNDEAFLASYDSTTAKLQASLDNAQDQLPVIESSVEAATENSNRLKDEIKKQEALIKDLQKDLEKATKEGAVPKVIDDLNASITVALGKKSDLQKQKDATDSQVDSLQEQARDVKSLIANINTQLAENAAKKDELESGGLDDVKTSLIEVNNSLSSVNSVYSNFIDENQATINAFETQDERRNKLIQVSSNRKIYERSLPDADNNVIANEDEVLKEVVELDLDIENLTTTEKDLLDKAIEDSKKEAFDPNFLSAEQASDMSRTANFSLLPVSKSIKEAAMRGLYSIVVQHLSDSNIYALEQSGYIVVLTPNDLPEFEVRWDKINPVKK